MKRKRDARIYLEDILSAIERTEKYTAQGGELFSRRWKDTRRSDQTAVDHR